MAQEENPSPYVKFFNKDFLADCTLEKSDPQPASYKAHRIVLAANSGYFNKYFQEHQAASKITLPKFVKPTSNFEPHDVSAKVLEFFYTNQTKHDLTELGLNKKNAFSFLSQFAGLEHSKGTSLTQDFIKTEVVDQDNCADCLINAIKADNKELKAKCIELLVPKFNDLLNDPKKKPSLLNMPLEMFKGILASDDLVVQNENALLNLVIDYIKSKESLPPKEQPHVEPPKPEQPKPAEHKPDEKHPEKPAEHPAEKPAEKHPEEKPADKPAEEKPAEKPAEEKKAEEKPADKPADKPAEEKHAEKPAEHPAEKPAEKPAEVHIPVKDFETEAEAKLKLYKLSQEEKRDLVKHLRLTHLSHEALIKASNNELFAEFKDIFIESLSAKLHNYESSEGSNYTLNLKPRHYTEPLSPTKSQTPASEQKTAPSQQTGSPSKRPTVEPQGTPSTKPAPEQHAEHAHAEKPHHARDTSPSYIRQPEKFSSPVGQNKSMPQFHASPNSRSQGFSHGFNEIPYGQTAESRFYQSGPQMGSQSYYPGYNEPPQQYFGSPKRSMDPETLYRNKYSPNDPRMQGSKVSGSPQSFQQSGIRTSGSPSKSKQLMGPLVFSYKYDFDDNGVLYYLGSFGKQYSWKNPHEAGQVQAFFSSLGKGALADFVGRDAVNCRTLNEPNSFMGLDLGIGRYLIPTCYTIRNRDTDHHVMLNWVLEGSTDLKEWFWIDKRTHFTEDQEYNQSVADVREELKMKGFTSTWGIDEQQIEKIKANFERNNKKFIGFRYFKVTQVNKNSSGSFNLGLSGFELYGVGLGDNWLF